MYDKSNIRKKVKKGMVWLAKCYHMKDVLFVYLHNIQQIGIFSIQQKNLTKKLNIQ